MNAVFTIVAKNYLPRARTLGDSIMKLHSDVDFYIILADEIDGYINLEKEKYQTIEAKYLNIPNFHEMGFKYNILEFCTAIKPYIFTFLFEKHGYNNIIYFDPDIRVFSSLSSIFKHLESNFIVITPHLLYPELNYTGHVSQEELLFVGMFNLGFIAVSNSERGLFFISWWEKRLKDKCYADKMNALHVDQKWIDFLPGFYEQGVCISRHIGMNVSVWNIHERKIIYENENIFVESKFDNNKVPLVFYHYTGFDVGKLQLIHKNVFSSTVSSYPDYAKVLTIYNSELIANGYYDCIQWPYYYDKFADGTVIIEFYRRLFRVAISNGFQFKNPFTTEINSFYRSLKSEGILIQSSDSSINRKRVGTNPVIYIIDSFLRITLKIIGMNHYLTLFKVFREYFRIERHIFILKDYNKKENIEKWRYF